jgi:hypothetical protein
MIARTLSIKRKTHFLAARSPHGKLFQKQPPEATARRDRTVSASDRLAKLDPTQSEPHSFESFGPVTLPFEFIVLQFPLAPFCALQYPPLPPLPPMTVHNACEDELDTEQVWVIFSLFPPLVEQLAPAVLLELVLHVFGWPLAPDPFTEHPLDWLPPARLPVFDAEQKPAPGLEAPDCKPALQELFVEPPLILVEQAAETVPVLPEFFSVEHVPPLAPAQHVLPWDVPALPLVLHKPGPAPLLTLAEQ